MQSQLAALDRRAEAAERQRRDAERTRASVVEDAQASEVEVSQLRAAHDARATEATALRALLTEMRDEVKGMAKGVATAEGQPVAQMPQK